MMRDVLNASRMRDYGGLEKFSCTNRIGVVGATPTLWPRINASCALPPAGAGH